ncbi:MAG: hypothetical protein LBU80_05995, partial [Rikenellaceae bacterium]|nr:hypothetical protein [Rikenellaceae bacterium]
METYNGKLCATYGDLDGIMSIRAIQHQVQRGTVMQARRACIGTPALFAVESLPLKYKTEVYRRYPDMKAQTESKPFIESIEPDGAALVFYQDHLLDDGKHLPTDKQHEYANNAAILNAFRAVMEKSISRRSNGKHLNKTEFWCKAAQALRRCADTFPNSLPENPRRLQDKFNQYLREGYASLVTGKYGTRNRAKVKTAEQESIIIKLLADPRNLDNMQIVEIYNTVGRTLGWTEITVKAVRMRREKYDLLTSAGRLGVTRFRNQREMQVTRSRPTAPLLYWTLDGWTAELLYQETKEKDGRNVTTYHNRQCMVVVLDPCNNYPVGYAIGDQEEPKLIKEALRNAANHTAQLFGCRYRTNQIQSDRYAYKKMKGTYEVMGEKSTPARAHNSKGKVIEPYFKYFNKKHCQYQKNWAGFGITSNPNNQPNSEFLNKHRHSFPDKAGCRAQLIRAIEAERAEKLPQYMELFAQLPEERKLPLSSEQYLLEFGAQTGHLNAIEGQGLRPTIGGIKREYDCFDPNFRAYAHVRWAVKYDPDNLDNILAVNEDGRLRFMLERKYVQPMALADRKEGDAEQLARVLDFNKQQLEVPITAQLGQVNDTVEQLFLDNPQLDIPTRLMLCDSRGQNKIHKQTRRVKALEAEDVEAVEVTMVKTIATRVDD